MKHTLQTLAVLMAPAFLVGEAKAASPLDFPIGIFSAGNPTEQNFRYVKALGFDYVHRYGLAAHNEKTVRAYMDMAGKCGLKVMLDISQPLRRMTDKKSTEAEALAEVRTMVARWKDHKALGFWYLYDEPGPSLPPRMLMKFHRAIKEITPDIPDAIAVCWIKNWDQWTRCADIIMPDFYPVRKEVFPKSMLNNQAEFFGKVERTGGHMVPIIQCFGFPRYPNTTEMRYMMYSTLTQNARGLFFWSYWRSRYQTITKDAKLRPSYLEETVKPALLEFKRCVELVKPVAKALHPPNLTNALYSSRQLLVGVWRKNDRSIVIAINNWPEDRDLSIPLTPYVSDAELRPLFSTRDIPGLKARKGTVKLRATPWETFVWTAE